MGLFVGLCIWFGCGIVGHLLIVAWWDSGWGRGEFARTFSGCWSILHACCGGASLGAGLLLWATGPAGPKPR